MCLLRYAHDILLVARCWRALSYYLCHGKNDDGTQCDLYGKSIRREQVEGDFEKLLGDMKPSKELFFLAADIFTDLWNAKHETAKQEAEHIRRDIIMIERKTEQFFDRITETDSETLITAYEKKIRKLEEEKIVLDEKIAKCGRPLHSFDETYRTAFTFLSNPQKLWASNRLEHKRAALKLAFSEPLHTAKNGVIELPKSRFHSRFWRKMVWVSMIWCRGGGSNPHDVTIAGF